MNSVYLKASEELRENPGQWAAYESTGHCVVLAGPGSGKTKTLTIKLARMLAEDVREPRGIACITYSNECARELKRRLQALGVEESNRRVFIGTIHSFSLKHIVTPFADVAGLGLPNPLKVATTAEQRKLFDDALTKVMGESARASMFKVPIEAYRRTHLDRNAAAWNEEPNYAGVISEYEMRLRLSGLIDFDDMMLLGLKLIESHEWVRRAIVAKFPILAVDEYQDLGIPLHRIVMSLCFGAGARLFAVQRSTIYDLSVGSVGRSCLAGGRLHSGPAVPRAAARGCGCARARRLRPRARSVLLDSSWHITVVGIARRSYLDAIGRPGARRQSQHRSGDGENSRGPRPGSRTTGLRYSERQTECHLRARQVTRHVIR